MDLNASHSISLSESTIKCLNDKRKRSFNPENWKDNRAKTSRNSGQPYVPRSGVPKPGKAGPTLAKACWNRCDLEGCLQMTLEEKTNLFQGYYAMGTYEIQRSYLSNLMSTVQGPINNVYRYFVHVLGIRRPVCKSTFMDIFGLSIGVIKILQIKIMAGDISITDGRGKEPNNHVTPPNVKEEMRLHILTFPRYPNHYSRRQNGDEYFRPDITIDGMFREFINTHPHIQDVAKKETLFRHIRKETGIKMGKPQSDTCKMCDGLQITLTSGATQRERTLAEIDKLHHLWSCDVAYTMIAEDMLRNTRDPNYVVIAGDLQQVLFVPTLHHGDVFYKRQLSCYNYCLYESATENGCMCVWDELIGHRGVDEIGSCLLQRIRNTYQPLQEGEVRTLVFWSDRCRGQINNYQILCLFKYLIHLRYFTQIEQKFLLTGHSYLPCDRLFSIIEKRRASARAFIPEEWVPVIVGARPLNPFIIQRMTQQNILNIKSLENVIRRPPTLRITEAAWIRMSVDEPHIILTRRELGPVPVPWLEHVIRVRDGNLQNRILNRDVWNDAILDNHPLLPKYAGPLPISHDKNRDLVSMLPYLNPQYRPFYQNLPFRED